MKFFFFKQKTAYEMRISDWSSDVCSSDQPPKPSLARFEFVEKAGRKWTRRFESRLRCGSADSATLDITGGKHILPPVRDGESQWTPRSEEHTSELQSLMRISYAVFCLKKNKNKQSRHSARSPRTPHKSLLPQ